MIEIHLVFNVLLSPPLRGGEKGEGEKEPFYPPPPHAPRRVHDCPEPYMVQGSPPPCLRRSGFAQAGIEGGGDYWGDLKYLLLIITVYTIMD